MPLYRRLPKFGFKSPNRVEFAAINLDVLQKLAEEKGLNAFTVADFQSFGLVSKNDQVKVLGRGEITKALEVTAHAFSASAKEAIEKAGGKAITL